MKQSAERYRPPAGIAERSEAKNSRPAVRSGGASDFLLARRTDRHSDQPSSLMTAMMNAP